jgi:hypothetical protein
VLLLSKAKAWLEEGSISQEVYGKEYGGRLKQLVELIESLNVQH